MSPGSPDLAAVWHDFSQRVDSMSALVLGPGTPGSEAQRAAGFRYLARFLGAGLHLCIEHDDADTPVFARMIENQLSWGLDNPDCNYSWARVSGDAEYRVEGWRGSAKHLEFQVNTGHFADGQMPAFSGEEGGWKTVSFLSGDSLQSDVDGRFEITLSRDERPGNWLALDDDASFLLVRQYFDDWEAERPGRFSIERLGASYPPRALGPEVLSQRFELLFQWLDAGAACWDKVSRLLLSLQPNSLIVTEAGDDRPGLHGQAYGMGPYACGPDEAVILEFEAPRECRLWSAALSNFWWESLDFGARQSSLNSSSAKIDSDGIFRGVICARDPGVPNWIDTEGCEAGTLALRFLFAEPVPKPAMRTVPFSRLRAELPADTPRVSAGQRNATLARRHRALQHRYGY